MNYIDHIYLTKVNLDDSYFRKYEKVPSLPSQKESGPWNKYRQWDNHDFPRVWCVLDFIEWTKNISGELLAYTCDSDPELEFIESNFKQKVFLPFPPYDLHDLPAFEQKFDFFLFNQTLEHLYDPDKAIKSIYNSIAKNGYVFTSVPTINIPHMTPFHFGGFTPMGLAILFAKNGFDIVEIGQWGNHKYIDIMFREQRWPDYNDLKNEDGIVTNERLNCCQCWILAQKKEK